jgi:hypothetical protein
MRARCLGPVLALAAAGALGGCAAPSGAGGVELDIAQTDSTRAFDEQLDTVLTDMIASAEIGPDGVLLFARSLGEREFLEPASGRYWQVSGAGREDFRSRSLWDRALQVSGRKSPTEPVHYDSDQFPGEPLRVAERTVRLPGSEIEWRFVVAAARDPAP